MVNKKITLPYALITYLYCILTQPCCVANSRGHYNLQNGCRDLSYAQIVPMLFSTYISYQWNAH